MADEKLEKFGKHIRDLRLEQAMTQENLAEEAGLHPTYIGVDLSRNCAAPLTAYYTQKENDNGKESYGRI